MRRVLVISSWFLGSLQVYVTRTFLRPSKRTWSCLQLLRRGTVDQLMQRFPVSRGGIFAIGTHYTLTEGRSSAESAHKLLALFGTNEWS